jgi:hypothetical protein
MPQPLGHNVKQLIAHRMAFLMIPLALRSRSAPDGKRSAR